MAENVWKHKRHPLMGFGQYEDPESGKRATHDMECCMRACLRQRWARHPDQR